MSWHNERHADTEKHRNTKSSKHTFWDQPCTGVQLKKLHASVEQGRLPL
jgi:hypothetical protein